MIKNIIIFSLLIYLIHLYDNSYYNWIIDNINSIKIYFIIFIIIVIYQIDDLDKYIKEICKHANKIDQKQENKYSELNQL